MLPFPKAQEGSAERVSGIPRVGLRLVLLIWLLASAAQSWLSNLS